MIVRLVVDVVDDHDVPYSTWWLGRKPHQGRFAECRNHPGRPLKAPSDAILQVNGFPKWYQCRHDDYLNRFNFGQTDHDSWTVLIDLLSPALNGLLIKSGSAGHWLVVPSVTAHHFPVANRSDLVDPFGPRHEGRVLCLNKTSYFCVHLMLHVPLLD